MKKIAIFASGRGSNAENIINYFKQSTSIKIDLIACNNPNAKVLDRANSHFISTLVFTQKELENGFVLNHLRFKKIEFIILAGFLLKIPKSIITRYVNKIINIHPSLLPLYGGKGMYGMNVHKKVYESKKKESGITIHFVNENYDDGSIIFQAKCPLNTNTTPQKIQKKIHKLELKFFPRIIKNLLNG